MGYRILLVEDNPSNRELFIEILQLKSEYEIFVAESGLKALEMLETFRPDLILMDIHMPGMDGLAVTRTIKSIPELTKIPIVALSALAMKSDIKSALEAGCIGYITKPVRIRDFLQKIENYIGRGEQSENSSVSAPRMEE
ncbi:response regulator [Aneurinibacillus aneurinilyticus]|jgi:CheY-like chemotaxis protein|uniref:Response regulator n=2 Tax=Aneurinibacillus aneurinilyticus TaxID=1391 RepID=A0A848CRS3_ANEAE|nr:response regulator [Aneurinibacillus aneurinilyticus]ERI09954.1 putative polar-differentiation response regulator DivK [Aneurinibacillus aneurinilyticus ATCC 12856]MCI1692611.1 response regulator [Aneurinibacillus aneurinilyticus]MED0670167.1 response regulator [Aneurinibacillus aneurinilyticus]MED0705129.1 response regulator [Aneurinibacillus aneurinilyticus]MED0725625.1 response regulator [Aneurinibacillus aneurinilyticus]